MCTHNVRFHAVYFLCDWMDVVLQSDQSLQCLLSESLKSVPYVSNQCIP